MLVIIIFNNAFNQILLFIIAIIHFIIAIIIHCLMILKYMIRKLNLKSYYAGHDRGVCSNKTLKVITLAIIGASAQIKL